jgi:hypothetical protein
MLSTQIGLSRKFLGLFESVCFSLIERIPFAGNQADNKSSKNLSLKTIFGENSCFEKTSCLQALFVESTNLFLSFSETWMDTTNNFLNGIPFPFF